MAEKEFMNTSKRKDIEDVIYKTFSAADKSGENTQYYKELFSKMDNNQFYHFLERRLPFRLHNKVFKESSMPDFFDAFKVLKKPLLEKVQLRYLYKDDKGRSIESKPCLVGYINIKRMKQMLSKKTSTAIEITQRDINGRLLGGDKGGQQTDRENESLAIPHLFHTMDEYTTFRADRMRAKAVAYNTINTKGILSEKDVPVDEDDSLAKNTLNVYMLGAHIHSNLIDNDYMTPLTLENKMNNSAIKRE